MNIFDRQQIQIINMHINDLNLLLEKCKFNNMTVEPEILNVHLKILNVHLKNS